MRLPRQMPRLIGQLHLGGDPSARLAAGCSSGAASYDRSEVGIDLYDDLKVCSALGCGNLT
jgi:hypothetical protein